MIRIGLVTTSRADWGHLEPLATALAADPAFAFTLFSAAPDMDMDLLLVFGDRREMAQAALTAAINGIPLGHLSGGDLSYGSADNQFRHAISKLAHLHFPSNTGAAARLRRMGECPDHIFAVGALSLDRVAAINPLGHAHIFPDLRPILVTMHPDTLAPETSEAQTMSLAIALAELFSMRPIIITAANADPGGDAINALWKREIGRRESLGLRNWVFRESLGWRSYAISMAEALCMVGNSSSGLIEAGSFELPVVDVGDRQAGRLAPPNVIHVGSSAQEISDGIKKALDPKFRESLRGLVNPYWAGGAVPAIMAVLRDLPPRSKLLRKEWAE